MSTSFGVSCEKDKFGVAVVRFNLGPEALAEDAIRPPASLQERPDRLLHLLAESREVLVARRPELVLVKHAVPGRFAADPQRYELGGVVQLACAMERVACRLFTTEQVRVAMGLAKKSGAYDSLLNLPAVVARSNKAKREQSQRMKTKWGSCNTQAGRIWLNSELAKKPVGCVEYIVVHEFVHLLEPTHSPRFVELMDRFLPDWRSRRDHLNSSPLAKETWTY